MAWYQRAARILTICGLATTVPLSMAAAAASAWTISAVPTAQTPNGKLTAVSCPAAGTCVAVGFAYSPGGASRTLAELWDGSSWHVLPSANPKGGHGSVLYAVSCRTARACTAVGSYLNGSGTAVTLAESWNGATWRVQPSPNPTGSFGSRLTGVSCPKTRACVAVGYYDNQDYQDYPVAFAESWNGTAWTLQQVPNGASVDSYLYAVDCAGPAACMATGSYSDGAGPDVPLAETWNGSTWAIQAPVVPSGINRGALTGVSCTAAAACTAVGDYVENGSFAELTLAEAWNGSTWAMQATPNPARHAALAAVSCPTAASCTAVGSQGLGRPRVLAETWDGSAWTAQAPVRPAGESDGLTGVSCTAAQACIAVGSVYNLRPGAWRTLAEAQHGSAWAIQAPVSPAGALGGSLGGVSCIAATSCIAVGSEAVAWNGATWTRLPLARPPGATNLDLAAVSCTAASFCMAVGSYDSPLGTQRPLAESWNGSRWRIEAAADPGGGSLYGVSCTAASFCMAVGTYEQTAVSGVAFAESWDGTSWSLRTAVNPSPTANDLYGVSCTAADACIAVGSYAYDHPGHRAAVVLAEAWNGTTWGQQPTPATDGIMFSVSCAAAGACAAVGYSGDNAKAGIWNGTTWTFSRLPLPPNGGQGGLDDVSCTAPDECTAVGSYAQFLPGSTGLALGEEWNGTAWVNQPIPSPRHAQARALTGISCTTASACTAVGVHYPNFTDYGVGVPFAEHRA